MVGFWINSDWTLVETVLNLLPLEGDHSGRATGKLLYNELKRRRITSEDKFSKYYQTLVLRRRHSDSPNLPIAAGSTTDNASVNGVANERICSLIAQESGTAGEPAPENQGNGSPTRKPLLASDIQVGCAAHATNLVVQSLLSGIGVAPDPDDEDWFEVARTEPIYDAEHDVDVIEETEKALNELLLVEEGKPVPSVPDDDGDVLDDEDDESLESEAEEEADAAAERDSPGTESATRGATGSKKKKVLTPVDKVRSHHLIFQSLMAPSMYVLKVVGCRLPSSLFRSTPSASKSCARRSSVHSSGGSLESTALRRSSILSSSGACQSAGIPSRQSKSVR